MDKRKNLAREITHLSLFSGIGGIDLAAEWAGIKTVGQCEWAEYPTKVLEKHWPTVPRWKDIRTLTGKSFYEKTNRRTVDIISGGFPCQPFSVAGKQRGKEDDRYLWTEMVRVIKELRPTWVVGENVAGIIRMALPDILSELEACGYRTRTFLIPACAVGARHRRYRVAIVGHTYGAGESLEGQRTQEQEPERPDSNVSDSDNRLCRWSNKEIQTRGNATYGGSPREWKRTTESILGGMVDGLPGWLDGNLEFFINHYWDEEPDIPRIATGVEHRAERIKCLGNAVAHSNFTLSSGQLLK